jgi:16S rRNA processing protein RimM
LSTSSTEGPAGHEQGPAGLGGHEQGPAGLGGHEQGPAGLGGHEQGPAGLGGHEQGPAGEPALLEVGQVARPHGLRGQVVVELWTNRVERMAPGAKLQGPTGELEVRRASPHGAVGGKARWLVSFGGVDDREQAEGLRGIVLRAEPLADADALWVHELIGAEVVDLQGSPIGVVEAVEANPASDLLVLAGGALIPLHFIVERQPGRLTADLPSGLLDL